MNKPKITFGIIVLNGEPFLLHNLRALYPFAHQIVVVEGACPGAKNVATIDGHSKDGTLEALRRFQREEDPVGKLTIVTAEDEGHPEGFWSEKDEMSKAYATRATGNYLWQVDTDEFYKPEDMQTVIDMLENDPSITAVTFRTLTFWGGLNYITDGFALRRGDRDFHRLFAWKPDYVYSSHRPPTVVNKLSMDLRSINWVTAEHLAEKNIFMYHYALLFPKQVMDKCAYYANMNWSFLSDTDKWAQACYFKLQHPFRVYYVHKSPSWLCRFNNSHPPQVTDMIRAVESGQYPTITLRPTEDIDDLLAKKSYQITKYFLGFIAPINVLLNKSRLLLRTILLDTPLWTVIKKIRQTQA